MANQTTETGQDTYSGEPEYPSSTRRKTFFAQEIGELEGEGEEWMISYLDILTLLVALFTVLLSISVIEKESIENSGLSTSSSRTASESSILKGALGIFAPSEESSNKLNIVKSGKESSYDFFDPLRVSPAVKEAQLREAIAAEISKSLDKSGLKDSITLSETERNLIIRLDAPLLFDAGGTRLSRQGVAMLIAVFEGVENTSTTISVEGHTDATPISNQEFHSNWELSAFRATTVARKLIDLGIDKTRVRVVGYADTKPVESNESELGKQKNRRVDLVLSLLKE